MGYAWVVGGQGLPVDRTTDVNGLPIDVDLEELEGFCRRWKVVELAFFGSVLRDDFRPGESDVDVLVRWADDARWGWEASDAEQELEALLKQKIDFVSWKAIEESDNYILRDTILRHKQVLYEAG